MKRRTLSFLLVLALMAGVFATAALPASAVQGVTEAQVTAKFAQAEEIWPDREAYIDDWDDGCTLCYGFIRELFRYLFDAALPTMWSVETASFVNNMQEVTQVGHLEDGYSQGELESLLAKTLPGDVLIASNGGTNHGVIIRSVNEGGAGVYVYDANWGKTDTGEPILYTNRYWSAEAIRSNKPAAVTVYRYVNYVVQSVAQSGGNQAGAQVHLEKINQYTVGQFVDVAADAWYAGSVGETYELGLMSGSGEDIFEPDGEVTIAQAISIASRIHSLYTRGKNVPNVSAGEEWYQAYLDYALQNGIIGKGFYESDVMKTATRAQFAEILASALPKEALYEINRISDNVIPDVKMGSAYAESIYTLYRAGIFSGTDESGSFSPVSNISRAEAACVIARMANSDNRITFSL